MDQRIEVSDAVEPEVRAAILEGIVAHNTAAVGEMPRGELQLAVRDPYTGRIAGGLTGRYSLRWLFVELLYLPADMRGSGLGIALMRRAEAEALARGCVGVWLDTFSFQARGFYERLGYRAFGTIEGYPPGSARHFMARRIDGPSA